MPRYSNINTWIYPRYYRGRKDHTDPRLAIARQMAWKKYAQAEYTEYPVPEPDNYNRAVFSTKPIDCLLVEDQVIYYDASREGWITVLYVPDDKTELVDAWIKQFPIYWHHLKPPKIKRQKPLLWTRPKISDDAMTTNEKLYAEGYYENFKIKYFSDDTEYVDSLLGVARVILKNPVPEELDYTDL